MKLNKENIKKRLIKRISIFFRIVSIIILILITASFWIIFISGVKITLGYLIILTILTIYLIIPLILELPPYRKEEIKENNPLMKLEMNHFLALSLFLMGLSISFISNKIIYNDSVYRASTIGLFIMSLSLFLLNYYPRYYKLKKEEIKKIKNKMKKMIKESTEK